MSRLRYITSILRLLLLVTIFSQCHILTDAELAINSCNYTHSDLETFQSTTKSMFRHAFDSYMTYAFPHDELRPLTCDGIDTFGGLMLSLVDTLDTLLIFHDWPRFAHAARLIASNLSFDVNATVSVFETTIRVLGGLLSAHGFLTDASTHVPNFDATFWYPDYKDELLYLAVDLADRLMPAFETETKIPFGSVHLQKGISPDESRIASTAGAGSLLLEFGTLSRYTNDKKYYQAAFDALESLHKRRAWTGLVGNHINIDNGQWVATEAGVGGLIDSYYEYMLKGFILFGDERLWKMFTTSYDAIATHVYRPPWFLDADMWSGQTTNVIQSSLSAFFPGLQVLLGRTKPAIETTRAHYSVWRKYGCLPEGFDVIKSKPASGRVNYPLRPELAEALFYLHWATNDTAWIGAARNMLHSLEVVARVPCGYAEITHVGSLQKGNIMPSFMMSETLKYLFLLFVTDEKGKDRHWLRTGRFVLTTEAHPLLISVENFEEWMDTSSRSKSNSNNNNNNNENNNKQSLSPSDSDLQNDDNVDADLRPEDVDKHEDESDNLLVDHHSQDYINDEEIYEETQQSEETWTQAHAIKCPRRAKWESQLTCGYGMAGTDFPKMDVNRLAPEAIAPDVEAQVQEFMRNYGIHALKPRMLFFGKLTAYRVVNIRGHEVLFTKLSEAERLTQLQRYRKSLVCKMDVINDIIRQICTLST